MNKKHLLAFAIAAIVSGCASNPHFATTEQSSGLGKGQVVTLEDNPFNLSGSALNVGDDMPSALLKDQAFGDHDTAKNSEHVRIYSIMPSIDTPVCDQQAHELSEFVETHPEPNIDFYAVSADTPFAQANFKKDAKITDKVTFLSDARSHDFGASTGTQIDALGLLTRTIIVVGKDSKVLHIQRVPELTTVPDLVKAVEIAQKAAS
ncbi:thioredoxin peroxidase [Veronia nyctiphanis]|uniref:Thioredoxin peroxidase n=1 Tax=Veronia nyctiphanis TaxID=1278244 RepID=A0A4Q0YQM0_9GAMM|nr:peroxiredoxin [Veronia nyctiphanis]RXJ73342.1 thioredoxin peroxidase [Veronia nyctiphanis]